MIDFWWPAALLALFVGLGVVMALAYELKLAVLAMARRGAVRLRRRRVAQPSGVQNRTEQSREAVDRSPVAA